MKPRSWSRGCGEFTIEVDEPGAYTFCCSVEGHEQHGMSGTLVVTPNGGSAGTN